MDPNPGTKKADSTGYKTAELVQKMKNKMKKTRGNIIQVPKKN